MNTTTEVRYIDFSEQSYRGMQELQERVEETSVYEGRGRWVLAGTHRAVEVLAESHRVQVAVSFTSMDPTSEISWGTAKAYIYALALGAAEGVKRQARRDGNKRFIPVGAKAVAEASLLGMRIQAHVLVLEPDASRFGSTLSA